MRTITLLAITATSSFLLACGSDSPSSRAGADAAVDGPSNGIGGEGGGGSGGAKASGGSPGGGGKAGSASGGKSGGATGGVTASGGTRTSRDASLEDGSVEDSAVAPDAKVVPDAAVTPHDDAAVGRDAGSDATDAGPPALRIRFANLATTTVPLDICMREAGSTFAGAPLLRARGVTTGLPYGSITDYLDLGQPKTLDFEFVEASTGSCAPPIRGYLGNLAFTQPAPLTIAVYQYQFTPIDAYNPVLLNAFGAPTSGRSNVRFFDALQPTFGASAVDFYVTPPAGSEEKWFTNVPFGSGTAFHAAGAGAHKFRVTPAGSQNVLVEKSAVVLSGNDALDAFLFPTSATTFGLLRCPSTATSLVGSCAL